MDNEEESNEEENNEDSNSNEDDTDHLLEEQQEGRVGGQQDGTSCASRLVPTQRRPPDYIRRFVYHQTRYFLPLYHSISLDL